MRHRGLSSLEDGHVGDTGALLCLGRVGRPLFAAYRVVRKAACACFPGCAGPCPEVTSPGGERPNAPRTSRYGRVRLGSPRVGRARSAATTRPPGWTAGTALRALMTRTGLSPEVRSRGRPAPPPTCETSRGQGGDARRGVQPSAGILMCGGLDRRGRGTPIVEGSLRPRSSRAPRLAPRRSAHAARRGAHHSLREPTQGGHGKRGTRRPLVRPESRQPRV